jgi:RNA polymerase sigma-70 factor (ECF subfamily)
MLSDAQRQLLDGWVTAVAPRALAYARGLLRDRSQAEDVVQECFYRLLRRADQYDLPRDGVKLLFKAISNLCINQQTRQRTLHSLEAGERDGALVVKADQLPEQVAMGRELHAAVLRAVAELPELQRAALELRALGQSKAEIAEVLDVSLSHAGVLVHRARLALAAALHSFMQHPAP